MSPSVIENEDDDDGDDEDLLPSSRYGSNAKDGGAGAAFNRHSLSNLYGALTAKQSNTRF